MKKAVGVRGRGCSLGATVAWTAAYAQEAGSPYINAGFQRLSVDTVTESVEGFSVTLPSSDHNSLVLRGGYDIETYLGAEAEIVWGLGSENVNLDVGGVQVPTEISVDRAFGAYRQGAVSDCRGDRHSRPSRLRLRRGGGHGNICRHPSNRRGVRRRAGLRDRLRESAWATASGSASTGRSTTSTKAGTASPSSASPGSDPAARSPPDRGNFPPAQPAGARMSSGTTAPSCTMSSSSSQSEQPCIGRSRWQGVSFSPPNSVSGPSEKSTLP